MISDVLCEAVDEIERYQKDFGDCYDDIRVEIDKVKAVMEAMRIYLDIPPVGEFEEGRKGLRRAISDVDTSTFAKHIDEIRNASIKEKNTVKEEQ